ncbi:hypothetical protein DL546_003321 [Coniochaeta pulveracea]|uniref:Concanavalin A-like lectin/glucanase n=1 Tax=Coniochaeta pulveracea TaxID=177199 RepID=A0A420YAJ2_9PEZI|nr:hypothetical protein DL546_003321 [Coniochaeta pulveracea]
MKPSNLLPLCSLIVLSSAAATPRLSSRRPSSHKLLHTPPSFVAHPGKSAFTSSTSTTQSSRAGVHLSSHPDDTTHLITSIDAFFTIPHANMPTVGPTAGNENGVYQVSYWVGIDGLSACPQASIRAGVDTFWDSGMQTTNVWYEFYPSTGPTDFANMTLKQGDTIQVLVNADADGKGGSVEIRKYETSQPRVSAVWTHEFKDQGSQLCLKEANWVIEDYPLVDRPEFLLPFANFTDDAGVPEVYFYGMHVNPPGAKGGVLPWAWTEFDVEVIDINLEEQGGKLTDCKTETGAGNSNTLTCKRIVGDA